jgi:hypothetical protein
LGAAFGARRNVKSATAFGQSFIWVTDNPVSGCHVNARVSLFIGAGYPKKWVFELETTGERDGRLHNGQLGQQ